MEFPTITSAIAQFLDEPELDAVQRRNTHKTYRTGLRCFAAFLACAWRDPDTCTTGELPVTVLRDFYRYLRRADSALTGERLADRSVEVYIAAVTALLRFMELQCGPASVLTFEVARACARLGKVHVDRRRISLPEGMPRILTYFDSLPLPEHPRQRLLLLRERAIMRTLYATGARVSEVVSLNRADVKEGHENEAVIQGKGRHWRLVYFTEEALAAIRAYLKERGLDGCPALFVTYGRRGGKRQRLGVEAIERSVRRVAMAAGVAGVTPHSFRHFRATQLLQDGLSLVQVQQVLGHANISTTTSSYIHLDEQQLKQAVLERSHTSDVLLRKLEQKEREREARGG